MKQFNPPALWRRLWNSIFSDVSGSGSSLSCSEEHEGNDIKTAGLMFQPVKGEECQGFKEDCRFNLD